LNEKSSGSRSRKQRLTAVGTRCTDHVTPLYPQNLALTSPTGGSPSVGIVRVRTKATEFSLLLLLFYCMHRNYCCLQEAISFRLLEIYYSGKCVGGGVTDGAMLTQQTYPPEGRVRGSTLSLQHLNSVCDSFVCGYFIYLCWS